MGKQELQKAKLYSCIGLLAHVDAGKTTLAEALLYRCGELRSIGRVDKGDAFLDTHSLEKARGITIFSKQAVMELPGLSLTLMDTPGHVDFSAEMERTLQVLDYAVLVINGTDGVQSHTLTLWRLLKQYRIPVFLFVNKMDQPGNEKEALLKELRDKLSNEIIEFARTEAEIWEEAALCDETALEHYMETGRIEEKLLVKMIQRRLLFPCYFGSALKLEGIDGLLQGLQTYIKAERESGAFAARAFKITRDEQGNRLTHLKILKGTLRVKEQLPGGPGEEREEKVNQIRIYSGARYETVPQAEAGMICAVTGPALTRPGQSYGAGEDGTEAVLVPVLTYRMILPEECDPVILLAQMRILEEEQPELKIAWIEETQEIQIQIMGEIQLEILRSLIRERFQVEVLFDAGHILYRETIRGTEFGCGHFEPLKHYAEVHLRLEEGEAGSGLYFTTECSEDCLDRSWQRLILTHLQEQEHRGVLTGSPITDMKITLIAGRAHQKHTEGGDFRQAAYRALRQGLMQAESVLLEPFYDFRLEVPEKMAGRAMADLERMQARFDAPFFETGMAVLSGSAPVAAMQNYAREVISYTKGLGQLTCLFRGYFPCHNAEDVMSETAYEPSLDVQNPGGSVFCKKGAGFYVEWDQAPDYMHIDVKSLKITGKEQGNGPMERAFNSTVSSSLGEEEILEIYRKTFYANSENKNLFYRESKQLRPKEIQAPPREYQPVCKKRKEEYLLVDGYNIIFAWQQLKELAAVNLDSARGSLLDQLCNYQAIRKVHLIVVFDAYKVPGHREKMEAYHNISVVYTKEAETADRYIERFAHVNGRDWEITVATSDATEQIIILGQGCRLLSAAELEREVIRLGKEILSEYERKQKPQKHFLMDSLKKE